MNPNELPNAETIKKFVRPSLNGRPVYAAVAKIEKNGTPLATQKTDGQSYAQWIDITPAMAADWLKNNFNNRPVSEDVVKAYARDMINGVWMPTHQGIAFNDEDRLIDGQHRLRAIVLANVTVRMMVTFNLRSEIEGSQMTTMDCVDRGRTRSVADQLKIQHGLKNGTQIAQVTSALAGLCYERLRRLSVGQTLDIYHEFKESVDFVINNKSKAAGLKTAGVLAGFAFVMGAEDCMMDVTKRVREMFFQLHSPEPVKGFPVIKLLRDFLTGENASLIIASMNRGIAELTVQAIYLELLGKPVEKLEFSLDGVSHFRVVQKERVAKIANIFKLPQVVPVAANNAAASRTPAQPREEIKCVEPAPESAPKKARPTLDLILGKVEIQSKLSKFILTGRGSDPDIDRARGVFIHLARSVGHTDEAVAAILKKSVGQVRELHLPLDAMSEKLRKSVETLKAKL